MSIYHNRLIQAFQASDTRVVVYLKQCEETGEFAVKVMHRGGTKTTVRVSYSLSECLRELAETVAQFSGGFTTWKAW
jgi:hypothetical protein